MNIREYARNVFENISMFQSNCEQWGKERENVMEKSV